MDAHDSQKTPTIARPQSVQVHRPRVISTPRKEPPTSNQSQISQNHHNSHQNLSKNRKEEKRERFIIPMHNINGQ